MKEKKQTIIYVVISIGLLLAAVVGATFAYFTAQRGEGANVNINASSGTTDSLTFRTEGKINIEANQENFGQENGSNQQASAKAIASLIASDSKVATYTYNVYLQIEENELTYTKDDSTPELVISIKNPEGTYLTELNGFTKTTKVDIKESNEVTTQNITGFDITKYTGLIPIAEDEEITAEKGQTETKTWEVYVTLIYLSDHDQNDNTGKQVKGTLIIQKDKMTSTGGSPLDTLLAASKESEATNTEACPNGIGGLIKHDKEGIEEPNGAKDDGYRYSGCNPNNFICFGAGSEQYNSGSGTCPLTNQYRIIGIVPVTKADGNTEPLIKVIKSEYITEQELREATEGDGTQYGDTSSGLSVNTSYAKSPRIQTTSGIHGFYWSGSSGNSSNQWASSTLKSALNGKYLTTTLGSTWADKIETVQWNVGGVNTTSVTPKVMKENEEKKEMGGSITSKAKIGLMYVHDYGFASAEENWNTTLYSYDNDKNRNANWLLNGVMEWTISRYSSGSNYAFIVYSSGPVSYLGVNLDFSGVRPVFYLKSNVEIKSDGADGSSEHPFRVQ